MMRKLKGRARILAALAFIALAAVFMLVFLAGCSSSGGEDAHSGESETMVTSYDITYDISSDRCVSATEIITIDFHGDSAFERLLEISNGEMVRNLEAVEIATDSNGEEIEEEVEFSIASTRYHDFSVEIGGESAKFTPHTYKLTYDYCITRADDDYTLTFLAFEKKQEFVSHWTTGSITCILPDNYNEDVTGILTAESGEELGEGLEWTQSTNAEGRTVISANLDGWEYEEGSELRITMTFTAGSLRKYRDRSPLWFAVAAAGLIVIVLILKFTVFRGKRRTKEKGFDAMKDMNPMRMGKLADNRVGREDISSLVVYWANRGYLKMDLTDPSDPTLVRVAHLLPEGSEEYEKYLFYNLFKEGKRVKLSSIKNKYYVLADAAAEHLNEHTRGLYDTVSIIVSLIITIIGIVIMGIAPLLVAQTRVASNVNYYMSFIVIIPALIIYAIMETLMYNREKSSRTMKIVMVAAVLVMCVLTVLAYVFLIPSYIVGNLSKEVISEAFCILFILAPLLIRRSRKYDSEMDEMGKLHNAIMSATKEDMQSWYNDDPQMYYKIMPYARVIGLAQYWEDKNQDMPLPPADWVIMPENAKDLSPAEIDAMLRKATDELHIALTSRPAPREEEHEKEEREKAHEGTE
ncbi:MAG: DUF2207 domain-containing protein [Clostridia bacterium]|nr:DUF2207 domain-containing protein [Clostridia bacterium]